MTNKSKLKNWLEKRFQLVLYHSKSYDIAKKYNFSRLKFLIYNFILLILLFTFFWLVVIYTPLKRQIPGFPTKETHRLIAENAIRADSLYNQLLLKDQYLGFLRDAIFNDVPIDEDFVVPVNGLTEERIRRLNDPRIIRSKVSNDLTSSDINNFFEVSDMQPQHVPHLFVPLKGVVTSEFNPLINHYGTDIVATDDELIKSVLAGTVIISNFTVETGYTIVVQHPNNILSVYRHAKKTLVKVGDYVRTGQAIAVYGDTGELSYGKHLHFELWKDGIPLNPENYIEF